MDEVVKEDAGNHDGESSQPDLQPVAKPSDKLAPPPGCDMTLTHSQPGLAPVPCDLPVKQRKKQHKSHHFRWSFNGKRVNVTCNRAGTVEEVLSRSDIFRKLAENNKNKELVIIKDGNAISHHCPCSLIRRECLLLFIKAGDKLEQSKRKGPSRELVMFHVDVKGGKNITKIMKNPALKEVVQKTSVYAYKGEKVKHALKEDGRFLNVVFRKTCALSHMNNETTEMSCLVDHLHGQNVKIILLNRSSPPQSQPGSLEDDYMMPSEAPLSDSDGNQDPSKPSTSTEPVLGTPKAKLKQNSDVAPEEKKYYEIQDSKKMKCLLSSQVKALVKGMKTKPVSKLGQLQNLFREEYGKKDEACKEVKTLKKLMELSNSVCHVRIKGRAAGSGFLLFDTFVLTNGHVIENVLNKSTGLLVEKITVHFSYESLDEMAAGAEVEEVAGFENLSDVSGHKYDWALLRLGANLRLPDCLLTNFGFLPQSGGICIIGHPDGGVKKIDPCSIIPIDIRKQVVERHRDGVLDPSHWGENEGLIQWVTPRFFKDVEKSVQQETQVVTYESCFYFGSSGSPVFDEHCNVVAIHSGGYSYNNSRGEIQNVIDFGYRLSDIIEHIIVQIVEREQFVVLKKYLSCACTHHQNLMTSLKKLVESRNPSAFRRAVDSPAVRSDESLKMFFEFLFQKEEPVPMGIDGV